MKPDPGGPGSPDRRLIAGAVVVAALAGGGWWAVSHHGDSPTSVTVPVPAATPAATAGNGVQPVGGAAVPVGQEGTPMAERVAVIGLLNKRNGASRDLTLRPGQAIRVGGVVVRLRACEQTAPWEQEQLTGAFVQADVEQVDRRWRRVFSGWLYKERPGLNVVQDPVYDVWTKSCTMSFPTTGPDTTVLSGGGAGAGDGVARSSRKKSPDTDDDGAPTDVAPAAGPTTPAKAADNNDT